MKKQISIIILVLAIMMVASGCVQKDQKSNVKNQNEAKTEVVNNQVHNQEQSDQVATSTNSENITSSTEDIATSTEEIKYLSNGEIDTSDWISYKIEKLGVEIKYPKSWVLIDLDDPKAGIALKSPDYTPIPYSKYSEHYYEGNYYIDTIPNEKNLSVIDRMKEYDDGTWMWFDKFKYRKTTINNREAVIFDEIGEGSLKRKDASIKVDDYIISVSYLYTTKSDTGDKLFYELLKHVNYR